MQLHILYGGSLTESPWHYIQHSKTYAQPDVEIYDVVHIILRKRHKPHRLSTEIVNWIVIGLGK